MSQTYYSIFEENRKQFVYFVGWEVRFSDIPKKSGIFYDLSKTDVLLRKIQKGYDREISEHEDSIKRAYAGYDQYPNRAYAKENLESSVNHHTFLIDKLNEERAGCSFKTAEIFVKTI